jgi:hypothetical protein
MKKTHRILHMASFSRSGETLFLRCLDAHPAIHVVHQIRLKDRDCDLDLFKFLMNYEYTEIESNHPLVKKCGVPKGATIVLKNAVWTHQFPFNGFVLVRNPFSVIQSFKITSESADKFKSRKKQLNRWASDIDPILIPAINHIDNYESVSALYNRKMGPLACSGLPIVSYEKFVSNPQETLFSLITKLQIDWDSSVLESHLKYHHGEYGHGQIKLWEPIHSASLNSWKKLPEQILSRIYGITWNTLQTYGYKFDGKQIDFSRVGNL